MTETALYGVPQLGGDLLYDQTVEMFERDANPVGAFDYMPKERVLLVGDTHGDATFTSNVHKFAREHAVTTIIQLGDFGFGMDRNQLDSISAWLDRDERHRWFWVDGNHDQHDLIEDEILGGEFNPNAPLTEPFDIKWDDMGEPVSWHHERMFYCPRGSGTMIGSKQVVFLGGAYSIDKWHRHTGTSYWNQEMIRDDDKNRTISRWQDEHVDVLITHDSPDNPILKDLLDSNGYKVDHNSQHNRDQLMEVVRKLRPRLLYHGHYHYRYTAEFEGCLVQGLAGNVDHRGYQRQAIHDNNVLIQEW